MGGSIANTYASLYPEDVSRLVIEDAAPRPANDPRPPMGPMVAPSFASRDAVVASVRQALPLMSEASVQERVDVYYKERPEMARGVFAPMSKACARTLEASWLRSAVGPRAQHQVPDATDSGRPGAAGCDARDGRPAQSSKSAHRGDHGPGTLGTTSTSPTSTSSWPYYDSFWRNRWASALFDVVSSLAATIPPIRPNRWPSTRCRVGPGSTLNRTPP